MTFEKADKSVWNTTFALPSSVRKIFSDIDKFTSKIRKRVGDADKRNKKVGKKVGDADKSTKATISDFFKKVKKNICEQSARNYIPIIPKEVKKRVNDNTLANIWVDIFENLFNDLDFL